MEKSASSARVRAFRTRLGAEYKRVEAYITDEEKALAQAIQKQQGCTMDTAIAGLIRLGLAHYEAVSSPEVSSPSGVGKAEQAFTGSSPISALSAAASPCPVPRQDTATTHVAHNPIAQFFKARSETLK